MARDKRESRRSVRHTLRDGLTDKGPKTEDSSRQCSGHKTVDDDACRGPKAVTEKGPPNRTA